MKFKQVQVFVAAMLVWGAAASGQSQQNRRTDVLVDAAPVKSLFSAGAQRSEERIIPMVLQRVDMVGDARTRLDASLDLEIISRWIASLKPSNDDHAAAIYLRLTQVGAASAALQEQLASENKPLNRVQQNAARQLHQLTYDLPGSADPNKLDEICRNVGMYVLELATGEVVNPSRMPVMRPSRLPTVSLDAPSERMQRPTGPGRSEPSRLIPSLTVSHPLRQQLLATLDMVERPAQYGMTDQDVAQLRPVLDDAIEIAAGLAGNAGVSTDDRAQLERQLTESLALFSDRRLRDLGRKRIGEMSQYRQVLGSINRLNLTEGNYRLLAPGFEYAQQNPKSSKQVLSAMERFVHFCAVYDNSPATLVYDANPTLARQIQKSYDDSRRAFESSRAAFLGDVENLGAGALSGTEPSDLDQRLDEMRIALDLIDALQAMPQALDTLNSFKSKSSQNLDRRVAKEATVAASPGNGPIRREATRVLKDMVRLADMARELEKLTITGPELEVFRQYTRRSPKDIYNKWRSNVTDVATQAANGVPLDTGKIDRNEMLMPLVQSLPSAVQVEAMLKNTAALERWADWGIDPVAVEQVLTPYRAAISDAFAGFLGDNSGPMQARERVQAENRPTLRFVLRSIGGASTLQEMPSRVHTVCAKLMTPLATNTYSAQRYFSLASAAIYSIHSDPSVSEDIRKALALRLRGE